MIEPKISQLVSSSRDRRSLEGLINDIHEGRVALLVGAGADIALSNSSSWNTLLTQLFPAEDPPKDDLVKSWMIELATVARNYWGDQLFYEKVNNQIGKKRRKSQLWNALKKLSNQVPLVVTTNYSRWLFWALAQEKTPTVVDRSTLKSIRLPTPGCTNLQPVLVHLHGRSTEIVLDRLNYDRAEYADLLYRDFLVRLFENWTVLAIGVSFIDPVLRAAASLARSRPTRGGPRR